MNQPPTKVQRLKAQLAAFLTPIAVATGREFREISAGTINQMAFAGIVVGTEEFSALSTAKKQSQLFSIIVLLTAEPAELKAALRAADGDFDKFYWDFAYDRLQELNLEALELGEAKITEEMPAIEAGQVEAKDQQARDREKPAPPNT